MIGCISGDKTQRPYLTQANPEDMRTKHVAKIKPIKIPAQQGLGKVSGLRPW